MSSRCTIDQRRRLGTRTRIDNQSGGFMDDEQKRIFIHDLKVDRPRNEWPTSRSGAKGRLIAFHNSYRGPLVKKMAGATGPAIDNDAPLFEPFFQLAAAEMRKDGDEKLVATDARLLGVYYDLPYFTGFLIQRV